MAARPPEASEAAEASVERKLAAILSADVAGYSRLMGVDEAGTLARLSAHREVIDELMLAAPRDAAHIYDAEEGTAATKTIPIEERGAMRGRNRTDGAYGIWGHDLQDLVVTAARWTRQPDGMVRIELHVES